LGPGASWVQELVGSRSYAGSGADGSRRLVQERAARWSVGLVGWRVSAVGGLIEGSDDKDAGFQAMGRLGGRDRGLIAGGETALAAFGQSVPWQLGFQDSATQIMDEITRFHDILLVIISLISAFVLALLVIVIVRFNARANPTPSRVTHNTTLEVLWTVVPVVILIFILLFSFPLLSISSTRRRPTSP